MRHLLSVGFVGSLPGGGMGRGFLWRDVDLGSPAGAGMVSVEGRGRSMLGGVSAGGVNSMPGSLG